MGRGCDTDKAYQTALGVDNRTAGIAKTAATLEGETVGPVSRHRDIGRVAPADKTVAVLDEAHDRQFTADGRQRDLLRQGKGPSLQGCLQDKNSEVLALQVFDLLQIGRVGCRRAEPDAKGRGRVWRTGAQFLHAMQRGQNQPFRQSGAAAEGRLTLAFDDRNRLQAGRVRLPGGSNAKWRAGSKAGSPSMAEKPGSRLAGKVLGWASIASSPESTRNFGKQV